jgi:hypothetical protein
MSAISSLIGQVIAGGCRLAAAHDCGSAAAAAAAAHVTSSRTTCRHASYPLLMVLVIAGGGRHAAAQWPLLRLLLPLTADHQLQRTS